MGWFSLTVPRSSIKSGLSLMLKASPPAFELVGIGKTSRDVMTMSENSGRLRFNF